MTSDGAYHTSSLGTAVTDIACNIAAPPNDFVVRIDASAPLTEFDSPAGVLVGQQSGVSGWAPDGTIGSGVGKITVSQSYTTGSSGNGKAVVTTQTFNCQGGPVHADGR